MIGFFHRFIILLCLTLALLLLLAYTLFGDSTNEHWTTVLQIVETVWTDNPILSIIFGGSIVSFIFMIALWMTIQLKLRDASAARHMKKLRDPTKRIVQKRCPKSVRQPIIELE